MLAPLSWLKQYVPIDMAPEEFARRMIMNGNAVEEVENLAAEVENVVVGKVLSVAPHANSDHLHICQVDVGQGEPIQIVTGADNMAAGDFVPWRCTTRTCPAACTSSAASCAAKSPTA